MLTLGAATLLFAEWLRYCKHVEVLHVSQMIKTMQVKTQQSIMY
jgi:hypothetical protein